MIRPRLDLMADMGVTTQAMSQAIRVATQGEIDQASARFSLSDRQVPIRVTLNENSRRSLSTIENMPVPTTSGGSVPLRVVAEISFGAGPSIIQRINQERRVMIGADLAAGRGRLRCGPRPAADPAEPARRRRARPLGPAAGGGAAPFRVPGRARSPAPSSSSRCWCCSTKG